MKLVTVLILIIISQSTSNDQQISANNASEFPFQKKLWSFWDAQNFDNAPIIVRACYQKIKQSAQKAGFEYTLVTPNNVHQFISNYDEKIPSAIEKSYKKGVQHLANLVRFYVVYEHGGIWMDITQVLIQNFDWLLNIKSQEYKHLITNRFSQEPDILLFYFSAYQNVRDYRIQNPKNSNEMMLFNEIPGYEIWFFAAKKNNQFMKKVIETYEKFTQTSYWDMMALFTNQNIYMNNQDGDAYLTGNMVISYLVQKKQFQLDRNISLLSNQRYTSFQHYKIWSLSGLLGPLTWSNSQKVGYGDFLEKSRGELQQIGCQFNFFVKFVGHLSWFITFKLVKMIDIFVWKGMAFQEYLSTKPSADECQDTIFLVQGSFVDEIFDGTKYLEYQNLRPITLQQYQRWKQYCKNITQQPFMLGQSFDRLIFFFRTQIVASWYKARQIVNYPKDAQATFSEHVTNYFNYNWGFIYFFYRIVIDSFLFYLAHLLVSFLWIKFVQIRRKIVLKEQSFYSQVKMMLFMVFLVSLSAMEHFSIDILGMRDDKWGILLVVVLIFATEYAIENGLKKKSKTQAKYSKMFYQCIYLIVSYWTAYMCLCNMIKNKVTLQFFAMVLGVVAPILVKICYRFNQQCQLPQYIRSIVQLSRRNVFRISIVMVLLILNLLPNSRYWVIGQHYGIIGLPFLSTIVIFCLYLIVFKLILQRKAKMQILRIILVGCLIFAVYFMIPLRNLHVVGNRRRVLWNLQIVGLFTTLYLQLGNSLRKKQKFESMSIQILNFLRSFTVFILAFTVGSTVWMSRIHSQIYTALDEFGIILLNNALLYWYQYFKHVSETDENQQSIQFVKFSQTQMKSQQQNINY